MIFTIDDFNGDPSNNNSRNVVDNTTGDGGVSVPSPIDPDNTVMNIDGGGSWSRELYAELLSGGEKVRTVVCYGCEEGHALSDPEAEGDFEWRYTGGTFDASEFEYFMIDYLEESGPIEPGGVVELYFDGVLAAQSEPLPGEKTFLTLPLLISDDSVSDVTIRVDGVEGLNASIDNAKLVIEPIPSLVFGTPEGDFFDTEVPDEKLFVGDNQKLYTSSGNDEVDVTFAPGDNRIDLGSGDDLLYGGTDNRILAGPGDDTLFVGSGGGNNTITGDSGMDQFWLVTDPGALPTEENIITDFTSGEDVIGFGGTGSDFGFEDLNLIQDGTDTIINAFEQDLARLLRTQASTLSESDFAFA